MLMRYTQITNPKRITYNMKILFRFLILLLSLNVSAQHEIRTALESGANNVSEGTFLKLVAGYDYQWENLSVGADVRSRLIGNGTRMMDAFRAKVVLPFTVWEQKVEAMLFYQYLSMSDLIYESNPGFLITHKRKSFTYTLGTHVRSYLYTNKFDETLTDNSFTEWLNLIYEIKYRFINTEKWQATVAVTNYDQFLIHQESNPFLSTTFQYAVDKHFNMYATANYFTAGAFNLHVNSFGLWLRLGANVQF